MAADMDDQSMKQSQNEEFMREDMSVKYSRADLTSMRTEGVGSAEEEKKERS